MNYERTSSGWQHEVVRIFTGVGAKDYICAQKTVDELWDIIYSNWQEGHIIGCGTKGEGNDQFQLANGLAKSHAYAILGCEITTDRLGR